MPNAFDAARRVGILPSAGDGMRLHPSRYPKELLPVRLSREDATGEVHPVLLIEFALAQLRTAGVRCTYVVTNDHKPELLRYLGDGAGFGVHVAFVVQPRMDGLARAVLALRPWLTPVPCVTCLAMPDTIIGPANAMSRVADTLEARGADLVLGVFPTPCPHLLGPVRVGPDGRVLEVLDKPAETDLGNTWGLAAWGPRFWPVLEERLEASSDAESPLGEVFNAALQSGLTVEGIIFSDGEFHDLGTPEGLARTFPATAIPERRGNPG